MSDLLWVASLLLSMVVLVGVAFLGVKLKKLGATLEAAQQSQMTEAARQAGQIAQIHEAVISLGAHLNAMKDEQARHGRTVNEELGRNRTELSQSIVQLGERVQHLANEQGRQQTEFRNKLDEKMRELRTENSQKLEEMRRTVDEKLQTTLERRLSESFKNVAERLEAVQKGLGEMQSLATGVGDLKRVLSNVKARGGVGEVQLELLIEDMLAPNQYEKNFACGRSDLARVEFAIRLPGGDVPVYLPVDSKFPLEDYERILAAYDAADQQALGAAVSGLERSIKRFARDIAEKYVNPPTTTDGAILFVPTEGLYSEILRMPGLFDAIRRDFNVTIAGPTNLQVLLSTFRFGYQQAALSAQASDIWKILGGVKAEFGKYGEQIDRVLKGLRAVENNVEKLQTRKNVMLRQLKSVESDEDAISFNTDGVDLGLIGADAE